MSDGLRDYNAEVEVINVDEAEKLRRAGKTYAEIAAYFGCTRQAVAQKLAYHKRIRRRYHDLFEACPYVGLRKFMLAHKEVSISGLTRLIYGGVNNTTMSRTRGMLAGKNTVLSVENVKKMERLTGLPFAELFRREDA